jgi:integrase
VVLTVKKNTPLLPVPLVALEVRQIEQRENRWVIVDFRGKGGRKRTVPVPAWVKNAIDAWTSAARITEGAIFRSIGKGGRLKETPLAQVGCVVAGERIRGRDGNGTGTEESCPARSSEDLREIMPQVGRGFTADPDAAGPRLHQDH